MKKVISFLFILSIGSILYSQDDNRYILNRMPEIVKVDTPNAASFNKFIDNPINIYNGTPDVSIPIYTLKDGIIEIPMQLRYNTSGIKVNEEASWVGLGWNLNVGGVITRQAVGGIDQIPVRGTNYFMDIMNAYDPDHIYTNTDFVTGYWSSQMRQAFDGYLKEPSMRLMPNEGRLNPDVFYLSYPGEACKFIIDSRNDSVYILNRESDIKIEPLLGRRASMVVVNNHGESIIGFDVTLPNGTIHHFDYFHNTIAAYPSYMGYQSESYVLSRTTYLNGQSVYYSYESIPHWTFSYNETIESAVLKTDRRLDSNNPDIHEKSSGQQILTATSGNEFILQCIRTPNYLISFNGSLREDIPNLKKLDRITIQAAYSDMIIKDFRLEYDYFTSQYESNCWSNHTNSIVRAHRSEENFSKRLKLSSIYSTMEGQKIDKYNLYYNKTPLPRKDSFAVDYWGYYNGQTSNKSSIPDLLHLMWHKSNEYDNIKSMPTDNRYSLCPALRAYNFNSCQSGILEGIQYPTGGYTEFIYEPHTFIDHIIPTINQIHLEEYQIEKKVRDNNSSQTPMSVKLWSYTFPEDTYITLEATIHRGDNSWESVANHQIQVAGSTLYNLNMRSECLAMQKDWEKYHINKGYTLSKSAYIIAKKGKTNFFVDYPDDLGDQTEAHGGDVTLMIRFQNPIIKEKRENQGGGLRIKNITFYDSPDKTHELKKTSYEYTDPITQKSSGILQQKLQFLTYYPQTIDVLGYSTTTFCNTPKVDMAIHSSDKMEISGSNFLSTPYQSLSEVGYSCVKETRLSDSNDAGYTIYLFHNAEPKLKEHSISLHDPLNGKLTSMNCYNTNSQLVKSEVYNYTYDIYHYYFGFNFYDRMNLFPNLFKGTGWSTMTMTDTNDSFLYGRCDNQMFRNRMEFEQKRVENTYFSSSGRLEMVMYPVNAYNITLKSKTVTQDGITIEEDYDYNPKTLQLTRKKRTLPDKHTQSVSYSYPNDRICGDIYWQMTSKHFISPIIEEKLYEDGKLLNSRLTEYAYGNNAQILLPSKLHLSEITKDTTDIITFSCSGINKDIYPTDNITYKRYDNYGNILEVTLNGGTNTIYLWGYMGQYPVAEIRNASYDEVRTALEGMLPENLSTISPVDFSLINSLRTKLPKAQVTTYKYQPLAGMTEVTSPSGYTTYYEYDYFGRLTRIYIKETETNGNEVKKTLQEFDYHYRN